MAYVYSPFPPSSYRLVGMKMDEVTVIQDIDRSDAIWNMFWMSVPQLDHIPQAGARWSKAYSPRPRALATIVTDVNDDEVLYRKLLMHPVAFAEWWEREDHTIYDAYGVCGEADWVQTVLTRADAAARRLLAQQPRTKVNGNVIEVNFRRAA